MPPGPNRPEVLVEIPKFTRVFCCIPMRIGLIIWAFLQVLAAITVITINIIDVSWPYDDLFVSLVWSANCFWLIDIIFSFVIMYGVAKEKWRIINITYSYCVAKLVMIITFLFAGILLAISDSLSLWYRTFDMFTVYFFIDNIALGFVAWIFHIYLTLLVRSQILMLGGTPQASYYIKLKCVNAEDPVLQGQNSVPSSDPQPADTKPPGYEEVTKNMKNLQPAV